MKLGRLLALLVVSFMMFASMPAFLLTAEAIAPEEVYVDATYDGDTPGWEVTHFDNIQDAIDAVAADGTIYILAGTYQEAIYFPPGKDLTVIGAGRDDTFIHAPDTVPARSWNGTMRPVVAIDNSTVHISGVTVDGLRKAGSNANMVGVYFWNSSGSLTASRVTGIRAEPLGGGQSVVAIMINHAWDVHSPQTVTISGNIIDDYQKGGIAVNEPGSVAHITNNIITGYGPTDVIAQNGIQFGYGNPYETNGTIIGNVISGNWYTPDTWSSAGILLVGVTGIAIENNTLEGNEHGVDLIPDTAYGYDETLGITMSGNVFKDSDAGLVIRAGCEVEELTGNEFLGNNIQISVNPTALFDTEAALAANDFDRAILVRDGSTNDLRSNHIFSYLQKAIVAADAGDEIFVYAGTYIEEGQIVIDKDLTIIGENKETTIIKPADNTGGSGDARGWFLVEAGNEFNLSNVTLDGEGKNIHQAIRSYGNGTIENNVFKNFTYSTYVGFGVVAFGNMTIAENEFSNIGRVGISVFGADADDVVITGNTYVGKGDVDGLDYAVEVGGGAKATIMGNTFSECLATASSDGSASAAILLTDFFGPGTEAVIEDNTIFNNTMGVMVGFGSDDESIASVSGNTFLNNKYHVRKTTNADVDLETAHDENNFDFSVLILGDNMILGFIEDAMARVNYAEDTLDVRLPGLKLIFPLSIVGGEPTSIDMSIEVNEDPADPPSGLKFLGNVYTLTMTVGGEPVTEFEGTFTLTIFYDPAEVDDPAELAIYWYDPVAEEWVALEDSVVDTAANSVNVEIDHFSDFALMEAEAYTVTFEETEGLEPTIQIALETDGERMVVVDGEVDLENGEYYFFAQLEGYENYEGIFTVDGEDKTVEFTMVAVEEPVEEEPVDEVPETGTGIMLLIPLGLLALAGGVLIRRRV